MSKHSGYQIEPSFMVCFLFIYTRHLWQTQRHSSHSAEINFDSKRCYGVLVTGHPQEFRTVLCRCSLDLLLMPLPSDDATTSIQYLSYRFTEPRQGESMTKISLKIDLRTKNSDER
jgi:hypothetical protein